MHVEQFDQGTEFVRAAFRGLIVSLGPKPSSQSQVAEMLQKKGWLHSGCVGAVNIPNIFQPFHIKQWVAIEKTSADMVLVFFKG